MDPPYYTDIVRQKPFEDEFNMENRDPRNINQHLTMRWDEIIAEPDGIRSAKCIWECSYKAFRGTRWCWYNTLAAIFFIPLAVFWGFRYACLSFMHIWCWVPFNRAMKMNFFLIKYIMVIVVDTFLAPLNYAFGLCFSRVRFSIFHENKSINREKFDV